MSKSALLLCTVTETNIADAILRALLQRDGSERRLEHKLKGLGQAVTREAGRR